MLIQKKYKAVAKAIGESITKCHAVELAEENKPPSKAATKTKKRRLNHKIFALKMLFTKKC